MKPSPMMPMRTMSARSSVTLWAAVVPGARPKSQPVRARSGHRLLEKRLQSLCALLWKHGQSCRSSELHAFHPFDKLDKAGGLLADAFLNLRVGEFALVSDALTHPRQEHAFGIDEGIAIAEDRRELFDRAQGAPHPRGEADETHGALLETFRELQHVDEVFEHARHAAVVFRRDHNQSLGLQHPLGKRREGLRLLRVGSR